MIDDLVQGWSGPGFDERERLAAVVQLARKLADHGRQRAMGAGKALTIARQNEIRVRLDHRSIAKFEINAIESPVGQIKRIGAGRVVDFHE